jgi:predicted Mrr-cat superfamily restriction endonuclease
VVWESGSIDMPVVGPIRHQFTNSIGVEKGDVIAYEFTKNVGVGYNIGTGDSRYSNEKLDLGNTINVNSLNGAKNKRSYSMGVYGLLNQ